MRIVPMSLLFAIALSPSNVACDSEAASGPSAGECRVDADCPGSPQGDSYCRAPGQQAACGVSCVYLQQRDCDSEDQCASGQVCQEYLGACCDGPERVSYPHEGRSSRCVDRCQPDSCGANARCGDAGLCETIPCTEIDHCGDDFVCTSSGRCARRPCDDDADCAAGACVGGRCFDAYGLCEPTVG